MPLYNRESLKLIGLEIAKSHNWGDEKLTDQTLIELGQQFWDMVEGGESITISDAAVADIEKARPKPDPVHVSIVTDMHQIATDAAIERTVEQAVQSSSTPARIHSILRKEEEKLDAEKEEILDAFGLTAFWGTAKEQFLHLLNEQYMFDEKLSEEEKQQPNAQENAQIGITANRARIMAPIFVAYGGNIEHLQDIESFLAQAIELERLEKKGVLINDEVLSSAVQKATSILKVYNQIKHWFYAREMGHIITDEKMISNFEKNTPALRDIMHLIFYTKTEKFMKDCQQKKAQWVFFVENNITKAYLANLPINRTEAQAWFQNKAKIKNIDVSFKAIPGSRGDTYMVIDDFAQVQKLFAPTHATAPSFSRR